MKFFEIDNNFTRGEIGQKVSARVGTDAYKHSCETLINFIPQIQGGIKKRNGFRLVPDSVAGFVAIHSFRYSNTEDFRIFMKKSPQIAGSGVTPKIGNQQIDCRVYSNDSYSTDVFDFSISCLALDLDLQDLDLQQLQFAQWQDLLFFVDPKGFVPPFYIFRRDAEEDTNHVLEPNVDGFVFQGNFWVDDIDDRVLVAYNMTEEDEKIISTVDNSEFFGKEGLATPYGAAALKAANYAKFPYRYFDVEEESKADNLYTVKIKAQSTEQIKRTYEIDAYYPAILRDDNLIHVACLAKYDTTKFECSYDTKSATDMAANEGALSYEIKKSLIVSGNSKVISTGFLGDYNQVSETVKVKKIGLPEWSKRNWPRTICVHQQRLIFGGSNYDASKVWCSETGNPFRFISQPRTFWTDDKLVSAPFSFLPVSKKSDPIATMSSLDSLFICSYSSTFNVSSNGPFNIKTININKEHGSGAYPTNSVVAGNSMYHIDISRRHIASISFTENKNNRTVRNRITDQNNDIIYLGFNEHIRQYLETNIEMVHLKKILWDDYSKILWVLTNIGSLFGCSIDHDNGVLGFFRVEFTAETLIKDMTLQSNTFNTQENLVLLTSGDKVLMYADTPALKEFELEDRSVVDNTGNNDIFARYLDQENMIYMDYCRRETLATGATEIDTGFKNTQVSVFTYEKGSLFRDTRQYVLGDSVYYLNSYFTCKVAQTTIGDPFKYNQWDLKKTKYIGTFTSDRDGKVKLKESHKDIIWGLPYRSLAKTNSVSRYEQRQKLSISLYKTVAKLYLSVGGRIGTLFDNVSDIDYLSFNNNEADDEQTNIKKEKSNRRLSRSSYLGAFDILDPKLFTGNVVLDLITDEEPWESIVIDQDEPFPFYMVGLFSKGDM